MRAPAQLVLDLQSRPARGRSDFFVSPANALALALLDTWPRWHERRIAVSGPQGAGKTHLAHVWAARAGAQVLPAAALAQLDLIAVADDAALAIEDVDDLPTLKPEAVRQAEEALFHLCNRLSNGGGSLMVSGRQPPAFWQIALPDLSSRLRAATVARLDAPDDPLLSAVLLKLFTDRQIAVAPNLIQYLLTRMDRSFEAAERMVARLDRQGMARHRPITPRLAAEVLATLQS